MAKKDLREETDALLTELTNVKESPDRVTSEDDGGIFSDRRALAGAAAISNILQQSLNRSRSIAEIPFRPFTGVSVADSLKGQSTDPFSLLADVFAVEELEAREKAKTKSAERIAKAIESLRGSPTSTALERDVVGEGEKIQKEPGSGKRDSLEQLKKDLESIIKG